MENQNFNTEETVMSQNNSTSEMTVTPAGKQALETMSGWMRFMAVLGFIGCAFLLLGGLIMLLGGSWLSNSDYPSAYAKGMGFGGGFTYLITAVLMFFPYLYLNRSSSAINYALMNGNNEELEAGLVNMKSYWKYMGILTIIMMGMIVLALIVFLIGGLF